jgi:hypothetical protein
MSLLVLVRCATTPKVWGFLCLHSSTAQCQTVRYTSLCTARFSSQKFNILPTPCIYLTGSNYYIQIKLPAGLCQGHSLHFPRDRTWMFMSHRWTVTFPRVHQLSAVCNNRSMVHTHFHQNVAFNQKDRRGLRTGKYFHFERLRSVDVCSPHIRYLSRRRLSLHMFSFRIAVGCNKCSSYQFQLLTSCPVLFICCRMCLSSFSL